MLGLKKVGPPRGMDPEKAFTYALFVMFGYYFWIVFFPWYGHR